MLLLCGAFRSRAGGGGAAAFDARRVCMQQSQQSVCGRLWGWEGQRAVKGRQDCYLGLCVEIATHRRLQSNATASRSARNRGSRAKNTEMLT